MKKISSFFKAAKRENGDTFITLTGDCPAWLKDAVFEAHCGDMPNDWTYATCRAVVDAIEDSGELAEEWLDAHSHEFCDGQVDVYTKDLFQWAADECLTGTWQNAEATFADSCDPPSSEADISQRIAQIQYSAISTIAHAIANAIAEQDRNAEPTEVEGDESEAS